MKKTETASAHSADDRRENHSVGVVFGASGRIKFSSLVKISAKNLYRNFLRSSLSLAIIVLLSLVIVFLGNFCYSLKESINDNTLREVNENGVGATLQIAEEAKAYSVLAAESVAAFEKYMKKAGVAEIYGFKIESDNTVIADTETEVTITGFLAEGRSEVQPDVLRGELWSEKDSGTNHIWISEEIAQSQGLSIGDNLAIAFYKTPIDGGFKSDVLVCSHDYVIKGIVNSKYCFADWRYLPLNTVTFSLPDPRLRNIEVVDGLYRKSLKKFSVASADKSETFKSDFVADIGSYGFVMPLFNFAVAVVAFLMALSIFLCVGCILNTHKISVENNSVSIGIMRALGMKNKYVHAVFLMQTFCLILLGVVIGSFLAWLAGLFAFKKVVTIIMSMIYGGAEFTVVTGFSPIIPLACTAILILILLSTSYLILKKYLKISASSVLREIVE